MGISTAEKKKLEIVEFLKGRSIFQVIDEKILDGLSPLFTEIECGPGHMVFKEGDPADALYIIKSGSVAVLQTTPQTKVLAFLTAGECFGEMSILQDTPRSASIRVPEEAVILRLPSSAVRELARRFPAITSEITEVINRRKSGTSTFKPPGLQGNLAFFDLPTVLQTILGSRQSGKLFLYGRTGRIIGEVSVYQSMIQEAKYAQLENEAALYELMNNSEPLDFTFEQLHLDRSNLSTISKKPPHMLLIEGARRADELPKLMNVTGWPFATFDQLIAVPDLSKFGADRRELCRTLCTLFEMGSTLEDICKQISNDRYTVLSVIEEMINAKIIKMVPGKQATGEYRRQTLQYSKAKLSGESQNTDSYKVDETAERPFELVKVINALNAVANNLGQIYGQSEIRLLLQESLAKACKNFPILKNIKVYVDTASLDMRHASSEFSESPESIPALITVSDQLLELTIQMQKKIFS